MNEITNNEDDKKISTMENNIVDISNQGDEHVKYLTFIVNEGVYGVGISDVKEIIEYPSLTRVPMTADFIRGVINLRGNVVPVIDLAVRLGKESEATSKRTCVIIIELLSDDEKIDVGFVVDGVNEVVDIDDDDIEAAPAFGAEIRSDFISGMGKRNDKFVVLLDLAHVLSINELAELTESIDA